MTDQQELIPEPTKEQAAPEREPIIELHYFFDLKLMDDTIEKIRIPRFTTRMKLRLGMNLRKFKKAGKELVDDELGELIIDLFFPELLDRYGDKEPNLDSLAAMITFILDEDGDAILGKDWRKKVEENQPKEESPKAT